MWGPQAVLWRQLQVQARSAQPGRATSAPTLPALRQAGGGEAWGALGRRTLFPGLGTVPNILTQGFDLVTLLCMYLCLPGHP